jgi:hypothetical protein
MLSFTSVAIALLVSVIGVGYTSYRIGINKGAELVVQHLADEGIIKLEEEDSDS